MIFLWFFSVCFTAKFIIFYLNFVFKYTLHICIIYVHNIIHSFVIWSISYLRRISMNLKSIFYGN